MPTNEELIRQLQALAATPTFEANKWSEKLRDFLSVLRQGFPDVDGEVEDADIRHPVMHVRLWPKFRPLESTYMISVALQGSGAVVLGAKRVECGSPNELWDYLTGFLSLRAFQATLLDYKRRNIEPVVGFLRTGSHNQILGTDLAVEMAGDEVKKVATGAPGPFVVRQLPQSTYAPFSDQAKYHFLTAAGFTVEVTAVQRSAANPEEFLVSGVSRDDLRSF